MNNKKILLVSSHLQWRTGLNTHMLSMYHFLKGLGYDVVYVCISGKPTSPNSDYAKDILVRDVAGRRSELPMIIDIEKPFLVISFDDLWNLETLAQARLQQPFYWIHYFLTEVVETFPRFPTVTDKGNIEIDMKKVASCADIVIPVTPISNKTAEQWGLENVGPMILPFIDFGRLRYSEQRNKEFREANKIPEDAFLFTFVANNFIRKNIPLAFQAFALASKKNEKAYLYLHVNPLFSPYGWDLRYLNSLYGVKDHILARSSLPGEDGHTTDEEMNSVYSATDCLINTSYGEGVGYPILEAIYMGCKIVTGSAGLPPYYLPKEPGFQVVPGRANFVSPGQSNQLWVTHSPTMFARKMNKIIDLGKERQNQAKHITGIFDETKSRGNWISVITSMETLYNKYGVLA